MTLLQILVATFCIAVLSLVGIVFLSLHEKKFGAILLSLVALSAGAMFGNAVFHLLPEAFETGEVAGIDLFVTLSVFSLAFVLSFLFEQLSRWHHCHSTSHHGEDTAHQCQVDVKAFSHLIIGSDAIHNFIDGLIIAASFIVSPVLGVTTAVAVALHEVPQELGDYAALVYGGHPRKRALILNFLAALTVVLGGIVGYYVSSSVDTLVPFLLPFAAGSFIYIAASDLLPELKHDEKLGESLMHTLVFLAGLVLMMAFAVAE